jgi:hypothetical protein
MTAEIHSTPSRRAVLAGAVGGLVALVAQALGRPSAARAGTDGDVALGEVRNAAATTGVTTTGGNALQGILNAQSFDQIGSAIYGEANGSYNAYAVRGNNPQGYGVGVRGEAGDYSFGVEGIGGTGVYGHSNRAFGTGVNGQAWGANATGAFFGAAGPGGTGVWAYSNTNTGVYGRSSPTGASITSPAKTGIYGFADADATARGVAGETTVGQGVVGKATTTGVGVRAESSSGLALQVLGRASFSRSGRLAIAAGRSSVAKTAIPLTSASMVLAVLQTNRPGIYVRAVVPNVAGRSFTIYLNAAVPGTTYVAWFVLN